MKDACHKDNNAIKQQAQIILSTQHICVIIIPSVHPFKFLMFSFASKKKKISYCFQSKIILSSKVNLHYGNGLHSWYLPILHEGGDWPRAIAKLVAHFHRPSQGENYVPNNKDSRCCSRINKTQQMAAFEYALFWDGVTSIKFYTCRNGFADMLYRIL